MDKRRSPTIPLLWISNLILLGILIYVLNHYHFFDKTTKPQNQSTTYNNSVYQDFNSIDSVMHGKGKIVMLGTSHTRRAQWTELLERNDVLNRGVSGDVFEGFRHRLQYVTNTGAEYCFIEAGTNDIILGHDPNAVIADLKELVAAIRTQKLKPVLTTIPYVGTAMNNHDWLNQRIDQVNKEIRTYASEQKLPLVALNEATAVNGALGNLFAASDGIHLTGKAYIAWTREIKNIIVQLGI